MAHSHDGQPELLLGHPVCLHMGLSIMLLDLLNRLGSRSDYLELKEVKVKVS